jgi:hypothetical protein
MNRTANNLPNLNPFFVADIFAEVDISDSDLESRIEEQKQKYQFGDLPLIWTLELKK